MRSIEDRTTTEERTPGEERIGEKDEEQKRTLKRESSNLKMSQIES